MTDPPKPATRAPAAEPPLAGRTVVALEQALAAPLATRQLADLGARVIKVERPGSGDFARGYDAAVHGTSSAFIWLNRSKESLSLDVKHPLAGEVLARLVRRADVLVQNLGPGAAARLGLSADAMAKVNERLIVCDISGFGDAGPLRERKAYDLLVQGEVGLISLTGTAAEPAKAGISIADIAAGMYAYSGILAALLHRERTGTARPVKVSLCDALAEWMSYPLYYAVYDGGTPRRSGISHATIAPYGAFRTGDGGQVLIAVQNDDQWRRFCEALLGRPELAHDERFADNAARVSNRAALSAIIDARLGSLDAAAARRLLDRADIPHARVNEIADLACHAQLASRDRWVEIGAPGGRVRVLRPPGVPLGFEPRMDRVPALGEHTEPVLRWLGFTDGEQAGLRAAGAV